MQKPMIRVVTGPSPTQTGVRDATTGGLSSVMSAGASAVDLMPHDASDLLVFLTNRAAVARSAAAKAEHMLGRLYNLLAGDDPDYIVLSGVHLSQTLTAAGQKIPDILVPDGEYKLRLDIVQSAMTALRDVAQTP